MLVYFTTSRFWPPLQCVLAVHCGRWNVQFYLLIDFVFKPSLDYPQKQHALCLSFAHYASGTILKFTFCNGSFHSFVLSTVTKQLMCWGLETQTCSRNSLSSTYFIPHQHTTQHWHFQSCLHYYTFSFFPRPTCLLLTFFFYKIYLLSLYAAMLAQGRQGFGAIFIANQSLARTTASAKSNYIYLSKE